MKIAFVICRILLGLGFVIFGANIMFPFLPQPAPVPGSLVEQFMTVMVPTHFMALIGFFQLIGGLCVLSGRMAPLGVVILAPILINILAFHVYLTAGEGLVPGLVFTVLELVVAYDYRKYLSGIFTTHAKA